MDSYISFRHWVVWWHLGRQLSSWESWPTSQLYPQNDSPCMQAIQGRSNHTTPKCNWKWYLWHIQRLVLPLIFESPLIYGLTALRTFSTRIRTNPIRGEQVQVLCLGYLREFRHGNVKNFLSLRKQLVTALEALLPHLTRLKAFDNRWPSSSTVEYKWDADVSPNMFALLARFTGGTLQSLKGLRCNSTFRPPTLASLCLFRRLEHLDFSWFSDCTDSQDHGIALGVHDMNSLHSLKIVGCGWIFKAFCGLRHVDAPSHLSCLKLIFNKGFQV